MTKRKQSGQILLLQRPLDYRPDYDAANIAGRADSRRQGGCLVYNVFLLPHIFSLASNPHPVPAQPKTGRHRGRSPPVARSLPPHTLVQAGIRRQPYREFFAAD